MKNHSKTLTNSRNKLTKRGDFIEAGIARH
jgi:hypothetical protein